MVKRPLISICESHSLVPINSPGLMLKGSKFARAGGEVTYILDCMLDTVLDDMDWKRWNALPESPLDKAYVYMLSVP